MLRLQEQPIGDSNSLYQTHKGQLGAGDSARDVVVKILRLGGDEKAFEEQFASAYKAIDMNGKTAYYRNFIEGDTLKEYLSKNTLHDDRIMELSNKLLAFLSFLHVEKQYHNRLSSDHILLKNNQIYLISEDNKLSNNPKEDIEGFGNVLEDMLKKGKKNAFYRDIIKKCKGEDNYFRTISDVLYRFKNRVSKLNAVPESFDKIVLTQLNQHGYPPGKEAQDVIDKEAYRMAIDDNLIGKVILRNKDKITPIKKGLPSWALAIVPIALLVFFGTRFMGCQGGGTTGDISFTSAHGKKQEMGNPFSFRSNSENARNLQWTVYDYNGRKIVKEKNKRKFTFLPEKPGKYFVTLENLKNPDRVYKDTVQVMWPGGKAQFNVSRLGPNSIMLINKSPFADSVFYDFGNGLKKMANDSVEYTFDVVSEPIKKNIQFAAYANGQADLQTKTITLRPGGKKPADDKIAAVIPKEKEVKPKDKKPQKVKSSKQKKKEAAKKSFKKPEIRIEPNYPKNQVSFRPSTASYDKRLTYEWSFGGQTKTGRRVNFNFDSSGEYPLSLKVMNENKVVHTKKQNVTLTKSETPIKDIRGTGLFKDN